MGERCISVVMCLLIVLWVVGSIPHGGPIEQFFIPMVCVILSVGWCIQKNHCCQSKRVAHVVVAAGFLSNCLSGPLPYV